MRTVRSSLHAGVTALAVGLTACGGVDGKQAFDGPEGALETKSFAAEEWRTQTLSSPVQSDHPYANNDTVEFECIDRGSEFTTSPGDRRRAFVFAAYQHFGGSS